MGVGGSQTTIRQRNQQANLTTRTAPIATMRNKTTSFGEVRPLRIHSCYAEDGSLRDRSLAQKTFRSRVTFQMLETPTTIS